jgi:transposase InsO family protein
MAHLQVSQVLACIVIASVISFIAGQVSPRLRTYHFKDLHQACYNRYWAWICRRPPGRPRIDAALIALIARMARENPSWGAPRIHGELLKLGYRLAQSTVSKYMRGARDRRPSQSWRSFLRDNADAIAAIDMLTVPTFNFGCLYALVVLGHGRRVLLHTEVAERPAAQWLANQIREAFPWDTAPGILLRDNDGAYGKVFRRTVVAMGIRDHPVMPHSPWQNGHAERLIGSIRRECLDHLIIYNAAHLRRVLQRYAEYYNNDRTHLALGKDSPNPRPVESEGDIIAEPILGGLHHRYRRIAPK